MKRIAINLIASLLLFIAIFALILWPASYESAYAAIRMTSAGPATKFPTTAPSGWSESAPYWITVIHIYNGRFRLALSRHVSIAGQGYGWEAMRLKPTLARTSQSKLRALWFQFEFQPGDTEQYSYILGIPLWFVILAAGAFPMLRFARRRRANRRRRSQCCPTCGYDLRASPERCPECGALTGAIHPKGAT